MKAATDNTEMNGHGCVPIKLYLQKTRHWPTGCSLSAPALVRNLEFLSPDKGRISKNNAKNGSKTKPQGTRKVP